MKILVIISFVLLVVSGTAQNNKELKSTVDSATSISAINPDSALYLLNSVEKDIIASKDYELLAELYRRQGNCFYFKSEYINAKDYYNKSLDIRQSGYMSQTDSTNQSEIGNLFYNLAIVNQYLGNYPEAIENSKKLEVIYKNIKDYANLAFRCYNYTAKLYYYLGDYDSAMEYSFKEVELSTEKKDTLSLSYAYDFQAILFQAMQDFDHALDLQFESLELRKVIGDSLLISYSYNNIGSTLLEKKEFQEALEYFEISLDIKLRNSFTGVAATYNNMGLSYQEMDDYPKSRDFYKASYDYCHQNKDDYGIVTSAINLGVINHLMNNSAKAEKYFLEAYNIAFKNGYKKLIVEATEFAHDFFYDMGRYEQAYDMLKQYVIYSDSIQNDDVIKEIARLEAEFEYNQKQISDSIMYHQQKIHDEALHEEELKRKEQLIWILAVTFAFIVFIAFALFKAYQLRRKNRENQLKQQALEIEKNLLRSQMNPHFIFNAMNSIQSFIAENDSYSALRYLSKFAKLIRLILENSMHQNIQLQDELQSLELYMELEKVRFNNKFDFKINIDDKIESDIIEVPPMLIQPFVENAIIHGVMPLEKEGLIEINMRKIDGENLILCEVTDNGIGREASAALKKSHGKKHKSVGMQVSRQRLESLNKQTQKEMSYQVEDIVCDGKVCGTKVSIIIPFISEF